MKDQENKGKPRKHHAHATEEDVPAWKNEEDSKYFESEYTLISALTGAITHGSDTWLIDSGASRHMTGNEEVLVNLSLKDSPHKVKLGDDSQYPIKGEGEAIYLLESGKRMKMQKVLYVPGLKKNLLSILALEEKGFRVAFVDG